MHIDFFEEFPEETNLRKAELIDFDSTIYLASRSLLAFQDAERRLQTVNPALRTVYWPILERSYWTLPNRVEERESDSA